MAKEQKPIRPRELSTGCKYTEFDTTPGSVHNRVVDLVPHGARVLEFGCATGYMSEALKTRRGCTVTGVELSEDAAELAQAHCERVIAADAEELDYEDVFGDERFDAILFADVLEHLRDPARLLLIVRSLLAEDGVVIASIPNVAHGSVRLSLLGGDFRYRPLGLLDDTHLRFFTNETIHDLFEGSGFLITHLIRQRLDIDRSEIALPPLPIGSELQAWLERDPEATTYQFILRAVPTESAQQIAAMRDALKAVRLELESVNEEKADGSRQLEALQKTADEQEAQIRLLDEQIDSLATGERELRRRLDDRIESLATRERELREMLLDAHDQLLQRDEELETVALAATLREEETKRVSAEREERLSALDNQIRWMETRRVWRLATRWWKLKSAFTRSPK